MTPSVKALQQQLQQLRAQHAAGKLGDEAYQNKRTALERKLLDALVDEPGAAPGPAAAATGAPPRRAGVQTWALLGLAAIVVAAAGYGLTGSPDRINALPGSPPAAGADGAAAPHEMGEEQLATLVQRLADRLKEKPDDVEGWIILGRTYAAMGRHDEALTAIDRALKLEPEQPSLLADYADALAVKNGRNLEGEPLKYIERALKIDGDNVKALVLAGTAAFNRGDYAKAVPYFEHAVRVSPPDSPLVSMAQAGADEARTRGKLPGAASAPAAGPAVAQAAGPSTAAPTKAAAAAKGSVSGTVTLKPDLLAKASPEDAVYIYARAPSGSRIPLALLRKQVKDLPVNFTLDDSLAMSPTALLSKAEKVVVGARVSKTGQAMPQPGDLEGLSEPLSVGAKDIKLVIGSVIK